MTALADALNDALIAAGYADWLLSCHVRADRLTFEVEQRNLNDGSQPDPEPRMALVRSIANRIEADGGEVTAGPMLSRFGDASPQNRAGIYSVLGRYHGRDFVVSAAMTVDDLTLIDSEVL